MGKRWGIEGLSMTVLAVVATMGCGDGVVGAGGSVGEDTGSAADLIHTEDTPVPSDTDSPDAADSDPDAAPDATPDAVEDVVVVPDADVLAGPDTEPEGCWSCTTQDPDCLCGCVGCHTNEAVLQELAPPEPVDEVESGGG